VVVVNWSENQSSRVAGTLMHVEREEKIDTLKQWLPDRGARVTRVIVNQGLHSAGPQARSFQSAGLLALSENALLW